MPKGLFTQSIMILLEEAIGLDEVKEALSACTFRGTLGFQERDAEDRILDEGTNWAGTEVLAFDLRSDARASLLVDVVDQPFPDLDGEPENNPRLYAAFAAGHLGPFVFPGCLGRAVEIGDAADRGLAGIGERHKAFIRLRATWALQAEGEIPPVPDDYDPLVELRFLAEIGTHLLELPQAICYFNPNGEVIATPEELEESLDHADEQEVPPLELWANLRFVLIEGLDGWAVADTIGMMQLDNQDHEALFRQESYDPREVGMFLRQASFLPIQTGHVFEDGEEARGPGGVQWRALVDRASALPLPRALVRWVALDGTEGDIPSELLERVSETD